MSITTKELAATISEHNGRSVEDNISQVQAIVKDYGFGQIHDEDGWSWADDDADAICLIAQGITDSTLVGEPLGLRVVDEDDVTGRRWVIRDARVESFPFVAGYDSKDEALQALAALKAAAPTRGTSR